MTVAVRTGLLVRSPHTAVLRAELIDLGALVHSRADGALLVSGVDAEEVGVLAARLGVVLHQLTELAACPHCGHRTAGD